jgi:hypothetical protein
MAKGTLPLLTDTELLETMPTIMDRVASERYK